jgi:hypothetical protein
MPMKKIKLIFSNAQNHHDLSFNLIESPISLRWFKKLRNIHRLPLSDTDSQLLLHPNPNRFDIKLLHEEFCRLAKIHFEPLDYTSQDSLNLLHGFYEQHHDHLVGIDSDCLYNFHQAIHNIELSKSINKFNYLNFGWEKLEGPLMERINMQQHYSKILKNGNLYLRWSELGKLPSEYFRDNEPNDQSRFNILSKPNKTLRAKFSLQLSLSSFQFTEEFNSWFKDYKESWLSYHGINDWKPIDEIGGVHVAEPLQEIDLENFVLAYPNFKKIELN